MHQTCCGFVSGASMRSDAVVSPPISVSVRSIAALIAIFCSTTPQRHGRLLRVPNLVVVRSHHSESTDQSRARIYTEMRSQSTI